MFNDFVGHELLISLVKPILLYLVTLFTIFDDNIV